MNGLTYNYLIGACLTFGAVDVAVLNLKFVPAFEQERAIAQAAAQRSHAATLAMAVEPAKPAPTANSHAADFRAEVRTEVGAIPSAGDDDALKNLPRVGFERGSYLIRGTQVSEIDRAAKFLALHREVKITIEGHCDRRGSKELNDSLSVSRARAVARRLIAKGVNPAQIAVLGFGAERPVDDGQDENAFARNRRVEIQIQRSEK